MTLVKMYPNGWGVYKCTDTDDFYACNGGMKSRGMTEDVAHATAQRG